jgi:dTDP-4-amino-4,6-dideoxygalactose transaminase
VAEVVRSGHLAQGDRVATFERAMAGLMDQGQGVAVSSGTAALHLALLGLGLGPDDEVVLPSYACAALWHAVRKTGAKPVLVDIDPRTYNISPLATVRAITARTKAVIVPHLFGLPVDLADLKLSGVPIIEDCAQTLGASVRGKPVGSGGDLVVCSFYATKLLTTGEGGMVLGRSESLMARIRRFRLYDEQDTLDPAFNYKMTEMQATMGLCQVGRLESFLTRRREIAARYAEAVNRVGAAPPTVPPGREHGYYRFVIRLPRPVNPALARAQALGIGCRRPVFRPLHRYLGVTGFPESDAAWEHALSIPIYPSLTDDEVERIVTALPALLAV